jgi:hypothetical protein
MVHRICVPARAQELAGLDRIDYADAYAAPTVTSRTPEQWVREVEDSHPVLLGRLVRPIHRRILGLRLAAAGTSDHILGFQIVHSTSDEGVLASTGAVITPRIVGLTFPGQLVISTLVQYEHPAAPAIWALVSPIHRAVEQHLLDTVVRQSARSLT